ncbi:MAG: peroxiredoxin [Gammaproteobacteria bacterium]|nr:MAG: peroxiredoxin [Gammaproteobacteria bacterium]
MNNKFKLITLLMTLLLAYPLFASPNVGSNAPDFTLKDQYGKSHALNDYKGQWLVMYFYPKDNTPGCSIEAESFRDNHKQFAKRKTSVVGISLDDVESHLGFSDTLNLNFSLLADEDKQVSKRYQVLTDLGLIAYASRETFLIDPDGRIAYHFDDVDPKTHIKLVLKKLDELKDIYK